MITDQLVSGTARKLTSILADLQRRSDVEKVVLSTADGLTVNGQVPNVGHMSAVGGFLLSAANLSSNLLEDHSNCKEVTLEFADGAYLVCRLFVAGNSQLILTVLFNQKSVYTQLLTHKIREIQQTLEK